MQEINSNRCPEHGPVITKVSLKTRLDLPEEFLIERMLAMACIDDAVFEFSKAIEAPWCIEEHLFNERKHSLLNGILDGIECRFSNRLLVIEQAQDFVELTGEYRLGYVSQPAGLQYTPDFPDGRFHELNWHMVQ